MLHSSFEKVLRQFLPEAIVVDYKHVGYPFYNITLTLSFLRNRTLELQEASILECITKKINQKHEFCKLLGVEASFVEKTLSSLLSKELITVEDGNNFIVTDTGKLALKQREVSEITTDTLIFYVDALTGNLFLSDNFNLNRFDDSRGGKKNKLPRFVERPKREEDIIEYYDQIQEILERKENDNHVELESVISMEKPFVQWHEITLVFYKDSADSEELQYETFSRTNRADYYRETIEKLYSRGERVLDSIIRSELAESGEKKGLTVSSKEELDYKDDIKTIEKVTAKIKELEDLDTSADKEGIIKRLVEEIEQLKEQVVHLKNKHGITDIIRTHEHPKYLQEAFEKSSERLMIVSPWLKGNIINRNFIEALKKVLRKGVKVHIIYGYKDSRGRSQTEPRIINELTAIADNFQGHFIFREVENTHSKILVCDSKFGINTSFNFLSFRGDPNQTYRDESGTLHKDKVLIEKLYQQGLSLKTHRDND